MQDFEYLSVARQYWTLANHTLDIAQLVATVEANACARVYQESHAMNLLLIEIYLTALDGLVEARHGQFGATIPFAPHLNA